MTRFTTAAAAFSLLSLGCVGSAQIINQNETGGTFALDGDQDKAMEDARKKMAAHCGPGAYRIVGRERAVVGTENYSDSQTNYDETENKQTDSVAAGASHSDHESGYDDSASAAGSASTHTDGHGNTHTHASGSANASGGEYSEDNSAYVDAKSEDQTTTTEGGEQTSSVSGTREVYENRLSYRCN